jgi:acyl-CoA-binding protein
MKSFFEVAQDAVRCGSFETSNDEKLMFYALYKIGTIGKAPQTSSTSVNPVEIAKRNAWVNFSKEYTKDEAQAVYTALVNAFQTRG